MKKLIFSLSLTTLTLFANETTILDITQFQLCSYKSSKGQCCLPKPFGILINANNIARVPTVEDHSQNITYADNQELGLFGFKVSPDSGGTVCIGAAGSYLNWSHNPYFTTKYFPFLNVGISGYTEAIPRWFWQAGLGASIQLNSGNRSPLGNSTRYSALLWGRYAYSEPLGINLGLLVFTGICKTTVCPIIGFDYAFTRQWQLYMIFPVNMALFYNIDQKWSLSFAGRPFWTRCRLNSTQNERFGIFEYRNYGTELSLNYNTCSLLWSLYGGYAYGGALKMEDSSGNTVTYRHYNGAPYLGVNFLWTF